MNTLWSDCAGGFTPDPFEGVTWATCTVGVCTFFWVIVPALPFSEEITIAKHATTTIVPTSVLLIVPSRIGSPSCARNLDERLFSSPEDYSSRVGDRLRAPIASPGAAPFDAQTQPRKRYRPCRRTRSGVFQFQGGSMTGLVPVNWRGSPGTGTGFHVDLQAGPIATCRCRPVAEPRRGRGRTPDLIAVP
jgi:hypothetical protein